MKTAFLKPGLLSVTFRSLSPDEIIREVASAGLKGIEWGGDQHVPPGDIRNAEQIGRRTRDAGLEVSAYGSYYAFQDLLPGSPNTTDDSQAVLDTAEALGTTMIRIWPGKVGSLEASPQWFDAVVAKTRSMADEAAPRGLHLGFEFHNNSLTDTAEGTLRLLEAINRDNVSTFWQTNRGGDFANEKASIELLGDRITQLHCHHLVAGQMPPYALLSDGWEEWKVFLETLRNFGGEHWISIEFVKDGSLEAFQSDAATLITWCDHFNQQNAIERKEGR